MVSEFEDTKRLLEEISSCLRRYRSLLQDSEKRHDEQLDEQQLQIDALESESQKLRNADEARANMIDLEWRQESENSLSSYESQVEEVRIKMKRYEGDDDDETERECCCQVVEKEEEEVEEEEESELNEGNDWNDSEERAALIARETRYDKNVRQGKLQNV